MKSFVVILISIFLTSTSFAVEITCGGTIVAGHSQAWVDVTKTGPGAGVTHFKFSFVSIEIETDGKAITRLVATDLKTGQSITYIDGEQSQSFAVKNYFKCSVAQ